MLCTNFRKTYNKVNVGYRKLKSGSVLFIEGWCIGFVSGCKIPYEKYNEHTKLYEKINSMLDCLVVLKPPKLDIVYDWRLEAEHKARDEGKPNE